MEQLATWAERLDDLKVGGKIQLLETDSAQSVYSAIRNHFAKSLKRFSIRTNPVDNVQYVIRLKNKN